MLMMNINFELFDACYMLAGFMIASVAFTFCVLKLKK